MTTTEKLPVAIEPSLNPAPIDSNLETGPEQSPDDVQPKFGRVRWWFEDSPVAMISGVATGLVALALLFILYAFGVMARRTPPVIGVAMQFVAPESDTPTPPTEPDAAVAVQQTSSSRPEATERQNVEPVEMPVVKKLDTRLEPEKLVGNQDNVADDFNRQSAQVEELSRLLRDTLERNQSRDSETGKGQSGTGKSELDPNTTPGRQARWIISYPTLPRDEYARMLDWFKIEMGYLQSDRRTMQYLAGCADRGRTYTGDAAQENRMFWYWIGNNRLAELDEDILRAHNLAATSEVVHLYPKQVERQLAELEKTYLVRMHRTPKVERIQQTTFAIVRVPGQPGWRFEVTGMVVE